MVIHSCICNSHVWSSHVMTSLLLLLFSHRRRRSVYHVVLRMMRGNIAHILAMLLSSMVAVLLVSITSLIVPKPLHHIFDWSSVSSMVFRNALGRLIVSLRVILMASAAACCHWLVYFVVWIYNLTAVDMLGCRPWSVAAHVVSIARANVMGAIHFLLAAGATVMCWVRVTNSWSSGLSVTSRRLGVSGTVNRLVVVCIRLSWKFARFWISVIVKPKRQVLMVMIVGVATVRLILIGLILGHQIIIRWWVTSSIQLLLVSQLLLLGRMNRMMSSIWTWIWNWTNSLIRIWLLCTSWT